MTAIAHPVPVLRRQPPIIPSGRLGMWWFLSSEIVTFGGVVVSYILLRLVHPDWLHHSAHTLLSAGAINTVVLLTSSLTVVLAHRAAEHHDCCTARRFLSISFGLGVMFLCVKAFEYHHELSHGLTPRTAAFWGFYYTMTGLHGLHVIAGLIAMLYLILGARNPKVLGRVAPVGLYWHFVDIVWIFLFPLLYVTAH